MRKQLLAGICVLTLALSIGCSKDDDKKTTTTTTPTTTSNFTAKLDGTTVNSITTTVTKQDDGAGGKVLSLSAAFNYKGVTSSVGFFLQGYTGVKAYDNVMVVMGSSDTSQNRSGSEFAVTITKDDGTYVTGTIAGTLYKDQVAETDPVVMTEGIFTMKLP